MGPILDSATELDALFVMAFITWLWWVWKVAAWPMVHGGWRVVGRAGGALKRLLVRQPTFLAVPPDDPFSRLVPFVKESTAHVSQEHPQFDSAQQRTAVAHQILKRAHLAGHTDLPTVHAVVTKLKAANGS